MRQLINLCILTTFLFGHSVFAQNGKVDVRVIKSGFSCDSLFMLADLEIKANDNMTNFSLADLNIRLSYNRGAFYEGTMSNPSVFIEQELTISDIVTGPGYTAFYNPHTLTGSLDTVISYNVELAGGDGYPVSDSSWTSVGQIRLQVKDINACSEIWVHTNAPIDFPPTFVSEKFNNLLYQVNEGTYTNQQSCFQTFCNQPPATADDYFSTPEGIPVVYNVLANDSDPDNNLDHSSLSLSTTPPANEATVTIGPGQGEITVTPTGIWNGSVTPFSYQICDDAGACNSATVYVTVVDDPSTSVANALKDKNISIYPTLTSNQVTVEFQEGWNHDEKITIQLYSLVGHLISEEIIDVFGNGHTYQTTLGNLPQGAYLLSLSNNSGTYTERIVKQ